MLYPFYLTPFIPPQARGDGVHPDKEVLPIDNETLSFRNGIILQYNTDAESPADIILNQQLRVKH